MANIDFSQYCKTLQGALERVEATGRRGECLGLPKALDTVMDMMRNASSAGNTIIFIGNGGSAAIASHMAVDCWKNGKMRAVSFNDASQLTCLSNDLGYEQVFSAPIAMFARRGDLLVAISSSGRSANIINAAKAARDNNCAIVTFSGFAKDNPLRSSGDLNLYVDDSTYGIVESVHAVLSHYILDAIIASH